MNKTHKKNLLVIILNDLKIKEKYLKINYIAIYY